MAGSYTIKQPREYNIEFTTLIRKKILLFFIFFIYNIKKILYSGELSKVGVRGVLGAFNCPSGSLERCELWAFCEQRREGYIIIKFNFCPRHYRGATHTHTHTHRETQEKASLLAARATFYFSCVCVPFFITHPELLYIYITTRFMYILYNNFCFLTLLFSYNTIFITHSTGARAIIIPRGSPLRLIIF